MISKALTLTASMCLLSCATSLAQLSGFVRDASNGEALPGATVRYAHKPGVTISSGYGFYSLPAAADQDTVVVSFVGYATLRTPVGQALRTADFSLRPSVNALSEVRVAAPSTFAAELATPQMARHHLTSANIRQASMMFGEPDVLKTLQMMPGVASAADGTTNMAVRGGSHDQNLVILDDAIIYNPSHAMGLFSTFNPDAVASADLYKGAMPARYGGRLSGVVDVRMREGDNQKWHTTGSLGVATSKLMVEGPMRRDT